MTADIGSGKGWTRHHLCQSVRGTLANTSPEEWVRMLEYTKRDDGTRFASWHDLRDAFFDELAKGHEVIPLSKDCVGFDFKTGCPGHPMEDPPPLRIPGPPRRHRSRRDTMSETTRRMREAVSVFDGSTIANHAALRELRDLAADAIEAVEAQVAEAVARVAALEKRQGVDETRSGGPLVGHAQPETPRASKGRGDATPSNPAGSQPAPAPRLRRFKPGDRVRFVKDPRFACDYIGKTGEVRTAGSLVTGYDYEIENIDDMGSIYANDADLEPAPSAVPAPELWHRATQGFVSSTLPTDMWPHEPPSSAFAAPRGFRVGDKVLVRGRHLARVDEVSPSGSSWVVYIDSEDGPDRGGQSGWWMPSELTLVRAAAAPEAPAEDAGLVERLAESGWEIGKSRAIPWSEADSFMRDIRRAVMSKALTALTDESRLCAPGEVARLTKERDEARAISAATAERVRNETQIATELRKDLDVLRAKLAAAESDRDAAFSKETALRRDLLAWQDAATEARNERDEFKRRLSAADREQERLRAELDEAKKWRDEFKRIGQAAEAELDALRAKPRFRTRPVTEADLDELEREYNKADYKADEEFRAARALGFRRRVEQSK